MKIMLGVKILSCISTTITFYTGTDLWYGSMILFICYLFNDAISSLHYIAFKGRTISTWIGSYLEESGRGY